MRRSGYVLAAFAVVLAIGAGTAVAASTVVVTPANTQGWTTADTRPGGSVGYVTDATAPAGIGALQLTTDSTNAAKTQYMHAADTPLTSVGALSYATKQNSASFAQGDPSYQLAVNLTGSGGFTTLVYEPYWNGTVTQGSWQTWDVGQGRFWSSKTVTCSNGTIAAGAGGPPLYTLADVAAACPGAVVVGVGVDVGTYNPSYDVETDLVAFAGTTYDFEPYQVAASKEACKQGGWATLSRADGSSFKNQGDCIQYVNTGK